MVFSQELQYDPEEWEECPSSEHFLAFSFFTRVVMTVGTIVFATFFFWLIKARKEWGKLSEKKTDGVNFIINWLN